MSQYIIQTDNSKQAEALLYYLKTLTFVDIKPISATKEKKAQAIAESLAFLNSLPRQAANQNEINKAINTIRAKNGYK